jgi:putative adhesin
MEERIMQRKTLRALGLVLTVGLLAGQALAAETFKERFEHTYTLAAGGAFTLKDTNGAVSVTAWERNEVHVVAEKQIRAASAEEGKRGLAALRIEATEKPGELRIDTRFPKQTGFTGWLSGNGGGSVSYKIEVPRSVRLNLETVNGAVDVRGTAGDLTAGTTNGAVSVTGVNGKIHLETTNGAISAVDAAGSVVAETTNGGIDVDLKQVPRSEDMRFSTTNGGITLKLPPDVRASISASTTNGRVSTDLPIQVHGKESKHRLDGDLNGGGGRLELSTTNGSIQLLGHR